MQRTRTPVIAVIVSLAAQLTTSVAAQVSAQGRAPAPSLRIEREIVQRGGACSSLAWSADGRWIAAGGNLGDVLVVDADTGFVVHELVGTDQCWIGAMRFAPDRSALFVAGRELTRWNLATGEATAHVYVEHPHAMAVSRDGRRVAYARSNDTVVVADADDLRTQLELKLPRKGAIGVLAFDPTGERLALEHGGRTCRFSLATGEQITPDGPQDELKALAYRDDGRLVRLDPQGRLLGFTDEEQALGICASGMSVDVRASLCVAWDGKEVRGLARDATPFTVAGGGPAAVHPDGSSWVRARDGQLEFHRGTECVRRLPLALRLGPGRCVFSRNGRHLVCSGHETKLYDLERGAFVPLACALPGMVVEYAGGDELALWQGAIGSNPATLTFWSIAALLGGGTEPARAHTLADADAEGSPLVFSRDGRHFALGNTIRATQRPEAILWRMPPSDEDRSWVQPAIGGELAWRVSLLRMGAGFEATVQRWRADGSHDSASKWHCRGVGPWSPNGSRVLVSSFEGLRVVACDSMETIATIPVLVCARWIDDERLLVLAGEGQLAIVAAATCTELARTTVPARYGYLAVAADGKRCACVLDDCVVVVRITL